MFVLSWMDLYYIFVSPRFKEWTFLLLLPIDIYVLLVIKENVFKRKSV